MPTRQTIPLAKRLDQLSLCVAMLTFLIVLSQLAAHSAELSNLHEI